MTREEAFRIFDDLEDEDEIQDFYEEQLFDYKKFFLSKAPIAKLFEGRVRKLRKLGEAYALISHFEGRQGGIENVSSNSSIPEDNILVTFQTFQRIKNELKRLISNAVSAEELVTLAEMLVALEKENASHWEIALESEEDIIVSKEPDPMYLLEAIQEYRAQGGETFQQLKNLENNPPELLLQEMKRLSLLFKKF